jgi:hypothetical protein
LSAWAMTTEAPMIKQAKTMRVSILARLKPTSLILNPPYIHDGVFLAIF